MSETKMYHWFQTGTGPHRWELAERRHPQNENMTVGAVAYVEQQKSQYWKWETYGSPHYRGTRPSLAEARRRAEMFADVGDDTEVINSNNHQAEEGADE